MSNKFSKTKKLIIEVARNLFAEKGKQNVTMNDIALASNKGRRTIYTYFKNKDEIYECVIKNEFTLINDELKENFNRDISPYLKLKNHLLIHLDAIKKVVQRNGTLRATFFKDILEVERYRKALDAHEKIILKKILVEGIAVNEFQVIDVEIASTIIFYSLKGLEVPYIKNNVSYKFEKTKTHIVDFILKGLIKEKS